MTSFGPRRNKTCLRGFRQSEFQTSLLSCRKFTYDTFQKANNKRPDQTALMRRLVCACVVCKPPEDRFLTLRPISSLIRFIYTHFSSLTLCKLGNFSWFCCHLLTFFSKLTFSKNSFISECQAVWIQIRTDVLSVLIRVQTVSEFAKGYQQTTKVAASKERFK